MWLLSFLKSAFSLDLFRINFGKASEQINILSLNRYRHPPKGLPKNIYRFFGLCFREFKQHRLAFPQIEPTDIVFFAASNNQREALEDLTDKFDDSTFWGIHGKGERPFPVHWAYYLSILYLPKMLAIYFSNSGYKKRSLKHFFDTYLMTYSLYIVWGIILKKSKPRAIVISNDHTQYPMTGVEVAKKLGIKTIYVQHANVTEHFPPLDFDYAFLEGKDAEEKYRNIGINDTDIILAGMPKFDKHISKVRPDTPLRSLGVCTNFFDEFRDIVDLLDYLVDFEAEGQRFHIIIRPHPADSSFDSQKDLAAQKNVAFSNSEKESSFDFLSKVEAIICGDSSIHLEAVLMNVYPIYYDFSGNAHDHYGFLENNLVDELIEEKEDLSFILSSLMKDKPNVQHRAKRYCSTVGTENFGKSTQLIYHEIKRVIDAEGNI